MYSSVQIPPQVRKQIAMDLIAGIHPGEVICKAADQLRNTGYAVFDAYKTAREYAGDLLGDFSWDTSPKRKEALESAPNQFMDVA